MAVWPSPNDKVSWSSRSYSRVDTTKRYENTLLRYFRENEFADFGQYKPVGKGLWGNH